ncbi:MAG: hypothetical protein GY814_19820, partial [Gammaproteobacteria bacterium]|nr:hypothetical protein [Gammaproteobacteria bacterium]
GEENWKTANVIGTYSEAKRDEGSKRYELIAKEEGVEVVYGHSRGAAVMSGMDGPWESVGLDGASYIGHEKSYTNVIQRYGPFDRIIGAGHKGNIGVENVGFHNVTRKKPKKRKSPRDADGKRQKMTSKKKSRPALPASKKRKSTHTATRKKKPRYVSDEDE